MIDYILRSFGLFDTNGLKYSTEHLRRVKNHIPFWSRENQAKYVDKVCKKDYKTLPFLTSLFNEEARQSIINNWNTTTVGNLAYISLHHPNIMTKEMAENILEEIRKSTLVNN